MSSQQNNFLTVAPGVVLSPIADAVVVAMDPIFQKAGAQRVVCSGKRNPGDQMSIIINEARRRSILVNFAAGDILKKLGGAFGPQDGYVWQDVWSKLLVAGFMVAPPVDARCVYEYKRPLLDGTFETIKADSTRLASGHFYNDFDISGRRGVQTLSQAASIDDETAVLKEVLKRGIKNLVSLTPEKVNGAVHCNVVRI